MKTKTMACVLVAALCLALLLPAAAETREGVIALEGQEEIIEETRFESEQGFSFWYANDRLEAYPDEVDNIDGVYVGALYSDDYMILAMIPEEDALEYTADLAESIAEQSAASRVQIDIYRDLEDGRYYFLTLIAENGQYLCVVGEYAQEAAEGNAKFFDRVLESVSFGQGCAIRAEWGEEAEEEGRAQVILTALAPAADVQLLRLDWDGVTPSWEPAASLGSLVAQQSVTVELEFIGDMPDNGILYTDEAGAVHAFSLEISGEDGHLFFLPLDE